MTQDLTNIRSINSFNIDTFVRKPNPTEPGRIAVFTGTKSLVEDSEYSLSDYKAALNDYVLKAGDTMDGDLKMNGSSMIESKTFINPFEVGDKLLCLGNTNAAKIKQSDGWAFEHYAGALTSGGGGADTGLYRWFVSDTVGTDWKQVMSLSNEGNLQVLGNLSGVNGTLTGNLSVSGTGTFTNGLSCGGAPLTFLGGNVAGDKILFFSSTDASKITDGDDWGLDNYAGALTNVGGGANLGRYRWFVTDAVGTGWKQVMTLTNIGTLNVSVDIPATSVTTGSLTTVGGIGVGGNAFVGGNLGVGSTAPEMGGGTNVFGLANATVVPTTTPNGGGVLYSENGTLKWLSPGGHVTTIAANNL